MTEPSKKPEEAKQQEPSETGDVSAQISRFKQEQANKAKEQSEETKDSADSAKNEPSEKQKVESDKGDKGEPSSPEKDSKEEDKKSPEKPKFKFVNNEGEDAEFTIKVDGEEIKVDDIDKLRTWAQQGYHSNTRNEELKKKESSLADKEAQLQKGAEMLQKAVDAKLAKDKTKAKEHDEGAAEEDDELTDPDVIELRKEMKGLKKTIKEQGDMLLGKLVEEAKEGLDKDIADGIEKYPLAKGKEEQIYNLLAKTSKDGKKVLYTPEQAIKKIHEESDSNFKTWLKDHPEAQKKTEEQEQEIIANYLKKKEEESAPVSPPSGTPAKTEDKKEDDEKGGVDFQMKKFRKWYQANKKAGGQL